MKRIFTTSSILLFTLLLKAQIPSYISTNGLLAWYPFNGNGADSSGNGNNLTNTGATFFADRNGVANAAASLNGTSNYFTRTNPTFTFAATDSFTYSFWMNKASQTTQGIPLMSGTNTTNVFISIMQCTNTVFQFGVNKQQSTWTWANATPTLNVWDNYIGTYSGGAMTLYKNGVVVANATFSAPGSIAQNIPLYIGKGLGSDGYFKGGIDDVAIWGRALSSQEVTDVYNSVITSVINVEDNKQISVFPNPVSNEFVLKNNFRIGSRYSIFDVLGKEVLSDIVTNNNQRVVICNLENGIYFLRSEGLSGKSIKLIKE